MRDLISFQNTNREEDEETIRLTTSSGRTNKNVIGKEKEVDSMRFDPNKELADTDTENNAFPKNGASRFDNFKKKKGN